MLIESKTNGDSDIAELKKNQAKLEEAQKVRDIAAFEKIVDPLTESIEELTDILKAVNKDKKNPEKQDYFDKELSKNLVGAIDKVFKLLQGFKQQNISIDLSPINAIAAEIKNQNTAILSLLNKSNNNQSDELCRMVQALIGKQNVFLEKSSQADYSAQLQAISEKLGKDNRVEKLTVIYNPSGDRIKEVIPTYKNK